VPAPRCSFPFLWRGGLSCGDGHGAQGDGEVCTTAIETALTGTFELSFTYPRAETATHTSQREWTRIWTNVP